MAAVTAGRIGLLAADEAPVFKVMNEAGQAPFLLTADHAGRMIPRALGDLGVSPADMERHIAWDIGIAAVTEGLAAALDATAILQTYSRLVVDCNRQPDVESAFPRVSEATEIPGNALLSKADKQARQSAIFDPYHAEIQRLLAAKGGRKVIYVAMHSFTPVYMQVVRGMQVAVLYHRNAKASKILAGLLRQENGITVAENEPYQVTDATDYGVPVHAEKAGLDYLEIEIRQDLIQSQAGQIEWVERLARLLPEVAEQVLGGET